MPLLFTWRVHSFSSLHSVTLFKVIRETIHRRIADSNRAHGIFQCQNSILCLMNSKSKLSVNRFYKPLYLVGLFGNHISLIIKKSQSIDATVLYSLEDILGQTEVYFT